MNFLLIESYIDIFSLFIYDKFFQGKEKALNVKQIFDTYGVVAKKYSIFYGVPIEYILGIIRQESAGKPSAIGTSGEIGLCQLTKFALSDFNSKNRMYETYRVDQLFNPEINIKVATWYLKFLNDYYKGDWFQTFRAYNAGIGTIKTNHNISKEYANSVIDFAKTITGF